ncbi:sushi domain protein [Ancylostoma caninum]|uniref:Sushi domain protein n=1 Tax=Ancylostoma caninum TaxID=29170 RepID=A0A368GTB9_ANCCA|nr:sushi domain protein [Ancylostoma caninum]
MVPLIPLYLVIVGIFSHGVAAIACPEPLPPANGMITFHGEIQDGTVITATCTGGGTLMGSSSMTCINGQWQPPTFGTCSTLNNMVPSPPPGIPVMGGTSGSTGGAQCFAMITPFGATISYSDSTSSTTGIPSPMHDHGSTATMKCTDNSQVSGTSSSTCQNGMWNPAILGSCSNGGFMPIGSGVSALPGMPGLPGLPTPSMTSPCYIELIPPINGNITYSSPAPHQHGSTATARCNDNSAVSGESTSTCQNGMWNPPTLGTCSSSGFMPLGPGVSPLPGMPGLPGLPTPSMTSPCYFGLIPPLNGNITYSSTAPHQHGSTATLTCNAGYTLKGNATATCNNGLFGVVGTCEKSP